MGEVTAKSKANRGNLRHELGVNEGGAIINVSAAGGGRRLTNQLVQGPVSIQPVQHIYGQCLGANYGSHTCCPVAYKPTHDIPKDPASDHKNDIPCPHKKPAFPVAY